MLRPRQTTKLGQGGIQIDQAGRLFAGGVRLDSRAGDEQRYARGFLPQSTLSPVLLFAQMESVIAPQHNQRVVCVRTGFQRIQDDADTVIDKTY